MYKGLASLVGMTVIPDLANLDDQLSALKAHWDSFDFFFVHYKYTDSRGEDGDFEAKVKEIEKVDAIIPRELERKPDVLVVTGDHSTPAVLKSHSWHPVPVLFWAPGVTRANPDVTQFGETHCLRGALGQFRGADLMNLITAHASETSQIRRVIREVRREEERLLEGNPAPPRDFLQTSFKKLLVRRIRQVHRINSLAQQGWDVDHVKAMDITDIFRPQAEPGTRKTIILRMTGPSRILETASGGRLLPCYSRPPGVSAGQWSFIRFLKGAYKLDSGSAGLCRRRQQRPPYRSF